MGWEGEDVAAKIGYRVLLKCWGLQCWVIGLFFFFLILELSPFIARSEEE